MIDRECIPKDLMPDDYDKVAEMLRSITPKVAIRN
jgi:hypothetical protein